MYLKQLYIHVSVQQKYTTTTEIRNQNDINVTYLQRMLGSNLQKTANKSGTILSGFILHCFHFVNTDSYPSKFLRILI